MLSKQDFLLSSEIVLFGISLRRKTFASSVKKSLKKAGFKVYPVNPSADGCYSNLEEIPVKVEAVYVAINSANALSISENIIKYGIKKVWLQCGSYNEQIINKFKDAGIEVYTGCLMMLIPGVAFIHRFHRVIHDFFERKK